MIRMQLHSEALETLRKVIFLTGSADMASLLPDTRALPPFCDPVIAFLQEVSKILMKDTRSKAYSDVMTFAFWIRKGSLKQIKEHYYPHVESKMGRGVAFHIAPSNVPINFAVSFTSATIALALFGAAAVFLTVSFSFAITNVPLFNNK